MCSRSTIRDIATRHTFIDILTLHSHAIGCVGGGFRCVRLTVRVPYVIAAIRQPAYNFSVEVGHIFLEKDISSCCLILMYAL